jgi:hypothetical protein
MMLEMPSLPFAQPAGEQTNFCAVSHLNAAAAATPAMTINELAVNAVSTLAMSGLWHCLQFPNSSTRVLPQSVVVKS